MFGSKVTYDPAEVTEMQAWMIGDEQRLVMMEDPAAGCGENGHHVFLLIDGFGEIAQMWRDRSWIEDEMDHVLVHEVEGDEFVSDLEVIFPDGRTNHDREIELEDLEPIDENEVLDEAALISLVLKEDRAQRVT